ncbi:AsmA family protein [Xanthobacter agilis]|uniref:AsmA protein n=1 Tax=Xanthobacter agilis TaxID=47492 RepID=A0ABU0LFW6_XANAG|nr:AsmA family protein [Xanthobacter agilis]MDQ0506036.1 AsmA protein [Xanthobacter agilis]
MRLGENTRRVALVGTAIGGLAVLVLVAALVVVPLFVPAAELRRAAIAAVAGTTERGVTISGEPVLRLLPSPRVELRKVTFALPQGQSLEADAVVSRISLWPLLFGRIVVSEVTLESPSLVLTGEHQTPQLGIEPFLSGANGPELRIVDGTIAWRSESGLTRELVSGIVGSLDRITAGQGITVSAVFDWRGGAVEAHLSVDDMKAFLGGMPTPTRAALISNTASIRFRGQASFGTAPAAEGTLTADADSLRAWLTWVGITPPTSRGLSAFALNSHVVLEGGILSFTDTALDLDSNRSEGGLLVKLDGGRPVIQGTFAAEKLNLNPYGHMRLTSDSGREWARDPFDLSALAAFDLDLRLSAGQVTAEDTTFTTVAASAVLSNGRLALALGQTSGWNGMLRGTATLTPLRSARSADGHGLSVRIEAECTDISLEQALDDLAGIGTFEGTGTLQFDLQGEGRNAHEVAQSLMGTVALASGGGDIVGFDVAQVLRRIERRPLSGAADPRGGRTPFTQLAVKASLRHGLATLSAMSIDGKQVHLDMAGTIDVAQRTLDLSGEAALKTSPKASDPKADDLQDIALPFVVEGPWASPRIMADPVSLIERSGAAQPLLEAVKSHKAGVALHTVIEKLVKPISPSPVDAAGAAN